MNNSLTTTSTDPSLARRGMTLLDRMSDDELRGTSAYVLAALLGKKVIHPGGRFSTARVLRALQLSSATRILEVGCGVGHLAQRLHQSAPAAHVTAIDIDPRMLERARERLAGLADRVTVREANVEALPFEDASFDRIVVESATMFTDRDRSLPELARVLEPGGVLVDHEFMWSSEPTDWRATTFERQFPRSACEVPQQWVQRYEAAGFRDVRVVTGPVLNFTPPGMLIDEGPTFFVMFARLARQARYLRRMGSFLWDLNRLIPWIRYGVVTARKPE